MRPVLKTQRGMRTQGKPAVARCALFVALLLGPAPAPAEPASGEGWLARSHLTGRWGGARDELEARGVDLFARYTVGFWSNLRGGFERGTRYEGFARFGLDLDLMPLLEWEGGRIYADWLSYHGGQPSTELVGAFDTTFLSNHEAETSFRFYNLYLEQQWLDGRLRVKGGQLAADDDFFVSEYAGSLLNATFGFLGMGRGRQIGPFYPLAAPGVYAAVSPGAGWFAHAGAYVADVGEDAFDNRGFDWDFSNGGFYLGEFGIERGLFGREGRYSLGAVGTTASLTDFSAMSEVGGKAAIYGVIDQALWTPASRPNLGGFLRFQYLLSEDSGVVHWYVDGGLELRRPWTWRPDDALTVGFAYLCFGGEYVAAEQSAGADVSDYQASFELVYRAQLAPWLSVQPDIQYFIDPHYSRRNAFALGLRVVVEL
jgi:porin